jgi:peptidoglycan/xylan/chitin deacetylase (PgdA/CDA1 family)
MKTLHLPRILLLFTTILTTLFCLLKPFTTEAQGAAPFRVYLTFEDGPTDAYTPGILDTLNQYDAKATFLIGGASIAGHEALIQREVREGHTLINHLWEEPGAYAGAPDDVIIDSYLRTEAALREALGPELVAIYDAQMKMYWQPGGGAQPLPYIDGVQAITYNWNINSDDCGWAMPPDVDLDTFEFDDAVIANVLGEPVSTGIFHNPHNAYDYGDGVVIAFHDINRVTGRVLPTILNELKAAGATFEALPRPWDEPGTMPIKLGVPPIEGEGIPGYTLSAETIDYTRIRATPSLEEEILFSVPPATIFTAIGRAPGWIQVQYEGGVGWIWRDLLKLRGAVPNLPLAAF